MPDLWLSAVFCQTKKKSLHPTVDEGVGTRLHQSTRGILEWYHLIRIQYLQVAIPVDGGVGTRLHHCTRGVLQWHHCIPQGCTSKVIPIPFPSKIKFVIKQVLFKYVNTVLSLVTQKRKFGVKFCKNIEKKYNKFCVSQKFKKLY